MGAGAAVRTAVKWRPDGKGKQGLDDETEALIRGLRGKASGLDGACASKAHAPDAGNNSIGGGVVRCGGCGKVSKIAPAHGKAGVPCGNCGANVWVPPDVQAKYRKEEGLARLERAKRMVEGCIEQRSAAERKAWALWRKVLSNEDCLAIGTEHPSQSKELDRRALARAVMAAKDGARATEALSEWDKRGMSQVSQRLQRALVAVKKEEAYEKMWKRLSVSLAAQDVDSIEKAGKEIILKKMHLPQEVCDAAEMLREKELHEKEQQGYQAKLAQRTEEARLRGDVEALRTLAAEACLLGQDPSVAHAALGSLMANPPQGVPSRPQSCGPAADAYAGMSARALKAELLKKGIACDLGMSREELIALLRKVQAGENGGAPASARARSNSAPPTARGESAAPGPGAPKPPESPSGAGRGTPRKRPSTRSESKAPPAPAGDTPRREPSWRSSVHASPRWQRQPSQSDIGGPEKAPRGRSSDSRPPGCTTAGAAAGAAPPPPSTPREKRNASAAPDRPSRAPSPSGAGLPGAFQDVLRRVRAAANSPRRGWNWNPDAPPTPQGSPRSAAAPQREAAPSTPRPPPPPPSTPRAASKTSNRAGAAGAQPPPPSTPRASAAAAASSPGPAYTPRPSHHRPPPPPHASPASGAAAPPPPRTSAETPRRPSGRAEGSPFPGKPPTAPPSASPGPGNGKPSAGGSSADDAGSAPSQPKDKARPAARRAALMQLGLQCTGTPDEINKAYKQQAMKWHPDRPQNHANAEEAKEKFQEVQAAYSYLKPRQAAAGGS
eukprot:TRINITY_DN21941_c0_g5_i1.p1 TRINITY_DN21941_c0_g5~~TRINITY_DN21941_c0_g5_i1.p1  ORF type:complete len:782 (-),score=196.96 TRINITY_DN21941_c0_g5_i1:212-2557(-)